MNSLASSSMSSLSVLRLCTHFTPLYASIYARHPTPSARFLRPYSGNINNNSMHMHDDDDDDDDARRHAAATDKQQRHGHSKRGGICAIVRACFCIYLPFLNTPRPRACRVFVCTCTTYAICERAAAHTNCYCARHDRAQLCSHRAYRIYERFDHI